MPRLTVKETAKRIGISEDSVLRRIRLKRLRAVQDNRRKWWVLLDDEEAAEAAEEASAFRAVRSDTGQPHRTAHRAEDAVKAPAEPSGLGSLAEVRELLGEACDRLERQHNATIALLVERIDAAEVRAETAENRLLEALERRATPWWSRWFGASKRSRLR